MAIKGEKTAERLLPEPSETLLIGSIWMRKAKETGKNKTCVHAPSDTAPSSAAIAKPPTQALTLNILYEPHHKECWRPNDDDGRYQPIWRLVIKGPPSIHKISVELTSTSPDIGDLPRVLHPKLPGAKFIPSHGTWEGDGSFSLDQGEVAVDLFRLIDRHLQVVLQDTMRKVIPLKPPGKDRGYDLIITARPSNGKPVTQEFHFQEQAQELRYWITPSVQNPS